MARASGRERASRSSLVTTSVSPARQAARASRSLLRLKAADVFHVLTSAEKGATLRHETDYVAV